MSQGILSTIYSKISSYIWISLLFNSFALKLFFDIGNYNILGPLLFFHFIFSLLISIFFSVYLSAKQAITKSALHTILIWPALAIIILHGTMTIQHAVIYFLFLFGIFTTIAWIQPLFSSNKKLYQLLFNTIVMFFLWGTNLIIETIPFIYDLFAPLTLSYHYLLIAEGIVHVGTALYIVSLMLISYGLYYEK